ncbi:MAG: hypothetical protein DRN37_06095 [Thermoplasmata archaeon]|nr:MAG: hypothetical protein DRN37_06095 [Thermoplasmata archaeon]
MILLGAILLTLLFVKDSDGITTMPRCAIIIVSDLDGFDPEELEKAYQFYQYLLDKEYTEDDIYFLTEDSRTGCDDDPTISNIEEAFSWLENTSESSSQPVIYISDHVIWTMGNATFQFSDGNLSANTIDGWLDSTEYQNLTMILNGNRSALAGPDLKDSSREIFCSMRSTQSFDEDLFNITRGLNDPTSDIDDDGDVSYHEAYLKECYNLRNEDQSPISYTE